MSMEEERNHPQSEETDGERTARENRQTRKNAVVFLAAFALFFAVSVVFLGLNISNMRGFETNGVRLTATVTGIRSESYVHQGNHRTSVRYYRIFSYEYNGATFEARDGEGWKAYKEEQLGKQLEIYVDPQNPTRAQAVSTVDLYSVISVVLFGITLPMFAAGAAMLLQATGKNTFRNRASFVWLPVFLVCAGAVLLLWAGLPHDGFGAVFTRVRGAIGYTVLAGIALVAAAIDRFARRKGRNNDAAFGERE